VQSAAPEPAARSSVEATVDALRAKILDGVLGPGARIVEEQASAELGVSRHTLRAALQQLVNDGLLRHESHRGVHIPVLAASGIADVFRLRALLEQEATRDVSTRRHVPDATYEAVAALEALPEDARWHELVEQDVRFHRAIIDAAGSPRLARAYSATQDEILFCIVQLRPYYNRPAEVAVEHRELLEPIAAGDVIEASRRLAIHLEEAQANLLSSLPGTRASDGPVALSSITGPLQESNE
jgi:DNA-binding GntR family transcriptional regulator